MSILGVLFPSFDLAALGVGAGFDKEAPSSKPSTCFHLLLEFFRSILREYSWRCRDHQSMYTAISWIGVVLVLRPSYYPHCRE